MQTIKIENMNKEIAKVVRMIGDKGFIAGSCARYVAQFELAHDDLAPYSDIDVFCRSVEAFDELSYILEDNGCEPIGESPNTVRYNFVTFGERIELIKPFKNEWMCTYGTPEEVLNQFDFTVVKAYIKDEHTVVVDDEFIGDNLSKRLVITHINCPLAVAQRVAKYSKKGYTIGMHELLKLFNEWDKRSPEYKKHLNTLMTIELNDAQYIELEQLLRFD